MEYRNRKVRKNFLAITRDESQMSIIYLPVFGPPWTLQELIGL